MDLTRQIEHARSGPRSALLEGVHALKHAVRFGAVIERVLSPDPDRMAALLGELAPDVVIPVEVEPVDRDEWDELTRGGLPSPALTIARRPVVDLAHSWTPRGARPIVLLDAPTHLGNVGASVRVAAAAGAEALVVRGSADPWHPTAIRGGAGLQFALPVARVMELPPTLRPLVAIDPDGESMHDVAIPGGAVLAFGTERHGLADDLLDRADLTVGIPMRAGVSSLNLATSVATILYAAMPRDGVTPSRGR